MDLVLDGPFEEGVHEDIVEEVGAAEIQGEVLEVCVHHVYVCEVPVDLPGAYDSHRKAMGGGYYSVGILECFDHFEFCEQFEKHPKVNEPNCYH